jgi:hypothetical protein
VVRTACETRAARRCSARLRKVVRGSALCWLRVLKRSDTFVRLRNPSELAANGGDSGAGFGSWVRELDSGV